MNVIAHLYRRWLNRHDSAWHTTGVRVCSSGYDATKAPQAARRQKQFEQAKRKAAATRARPMRVKGTVTAFTKGAAR